MNSQETIDEKVERFKKFNFDIIDHAISISKKGSDNIHSTILLCSVFDSLSKSRFPDEKKNAFRFKKMVNECDQWSESQHISLLHLVRAFEIESEISGEFKILKNWSIEKLSKHLPEPSSPNQRSPGIEITVDPCASEIEKIWPKDSNNDYLKIGNKRPFHFKHEHMIWLYRNSVVHEYRIPGNGTESIMQSVDYPYYMKVSSSKFGLRNSINYSSNWELVYPMNFFEKICRNAVETVAEWHRQNKTSPFEAYSDGSYWIPDLNEE